MADPFAHPHTDWYFSSSTTNQEEYAPILPHHDDQLTSNEHTDVQPIDNKFLDPSHLPDATTNVNYNSPLSHTFKYLNDQSVGEISHINFDFSFNGAQNNDLAFQWSEQVQNVAQDVNSSGTQAVEYIGSTVETFDAGLGHHYTPESRHHSIARTYQDVPSTSHTQELSQTSLHYPSTGIPSPLPSISHSPSASNVCTVQPTPDSRVFVFRCTFSRCRAKTFGRWADFHRHYNGAHAFEKTVFWCPVEQCSRSEGGGHRGFPRKDKMMVHVEKMHGVKDRDGGAIFG